MLTTEDIEQKTFSTALRGYDLNEVDDFLDEIMATIRDLTEQLQAARSGQPQPASAPVESLAAIDETAVGRALIAAQEAADRIVDEARQEAEKIKAEARQEADTWVNERDALRTEAEKEMADLSSRVAAVRRELAVLATGVADGLDKMDAAIGSTSGLEEPETPTVVAESDVSDAPEEELPWGSGVGDSQSAHSPDTPDSEDSPDTPDSEDSEDSPDTPDDDDSDEPDVLSDDDQDFGDESEEGDDFDRSL